MKKMWDGRFSKESSELLEIFNASITFDQRMYKEDIKGSIAHATMLAHVGIITREESFLICEGLQKIEQEIAEGTFVFSVFDEDIHMAIEKRLTEIIGPVAGKLHTSRSRNDQVALDFRMYLRKQAVKIDRQLQSLQTVLYELAKREEKTLIPSYTHLQRAQPIVLAHHFLAYFEMFKRDRSRITDYLERTDEMPLGSGALAGTTFPIDRHYTAELLGFSRVSNNSLDAVSDRDFVIELASILSMIAMHLSRFSEEIILWSTSEFQFIQLDDAYATGSSIMPQKKNPDVAELIRGKTGRVYGSLIAILTTMKGLPLAYNKDMQEDKEGIFDACDTIDISLQIFTEMLKTLVVNKEHILQTMAAGFLNATDVADYLAKKGLPFREAHHVSGSIVSYCETNDKTIEMLSLEEFQTFSPLFSADIHERITLEGCANNRNSFGGTGSEAVAYQLKQAEKYLKGVL